MEQFPWTESGLELLLVMKVLIREQGGNERLADKIESEWIKETLFNLPSGDKKGTHRPKWSPDHEKILRENIYKIGFKEIGEMVGRDTESTYNKARRLGIAIRKY